MWQLYGFNSCHHIVWFFEHIYCFKTELDFKYYASNSNVNYNMMQVVYSCEISKTEHCVATMKLLGISWMLLQKKYMCGKQGSSPYTLICTLYIHVYGVSFNPVIFFLGNNFLYSHTCIQYIVLHLWIRHYFSRNFNIYRRFYGRCLFIT